MMIVKYYLFMDQNSEIIRSVREGFERGDDSDPTQVVHLGGMNFKRDVEGTYIEYHHFLFGEPGAIVNMAASAVRLVELSEVFPHNPVEGGSSFAMQRGVYVHDRARAIVDETSTGDTLKSATCLRVVAPDVYQAISLFNHIRAGRAVPIVSWHDRPLNEPDDM